MRGWFSRDYEPVATVDPGEPVVFTARNSGWKWDPVNTTDRPEGAGHALEGPFEVRGARAGGTLVVHIDEVTPRGWGETWGNGEGFVWRLEDEWWILGDHRVRSAPFLGVIGMPPPEAGEHSMITAAQMGRQHRLQAARRRHDARSPDPGGRRAVDGGRRPRSAGRRRGLRHRDRVPARARTAELRAERAGSCNGRSHAPPTRGSHSASTRISISPQSTSTENMLDLMERELGVPRNEALALASVSVDLHVTQIVNAAKGVHAILRA